MEDTTADDTADGSLIDDTHLFTEGLATKRPPGPELGFAGTALSGGGGRRSSPPPDHQASVVTFDVEVEGRVSEMIVEAGGVGMGAGEAAEGGKGGELGVREAAGLELGGGVGEGEAPFVACPMCTCHNDLTAERCSACGEILFS